MKKILLYLFCILEINVFSESYIMATDVWQPFRIEKENKLHGIDIDMLKLIEDKTNLDLVVAQKPWVRCLEDMKSGKVDLMLGLAFNNERAKYIKYLDIPYYSVTPGFYIKNRDVKIDTYQDLGKYRIGYVSGSSYFPIFDQDNELNKIPVAKETQLIEMLLRSSIDVLIGTNVQIQYELKEKGLSKIIVKVEYSPDYKIDLYLGISKKSELLKEEIILKDALSEIIEKGELDNIITNYTN